MKRKIWALLLAGSSVESMNRPTVMTAVPAIGNVR